MTAEPLRFAPQQASGNDPLGGAQPIAMNVMIDGNGTIRKRPGIRLLPDGPQVPVSSHPLTGIHRCLNGDIFAVAESGPEREIVRVNGTSFSVLGGGVPPAGLRGAGRPTFAETEMLLVIAGGADMQKIELATLASSRLGGAPPIATHVLTKSLRLLANDDVVDRTKIRYSDVAQGTVTYAGHETWTPGPTNDSGFFTAEARPDPVVGLLDTAELVYVLGANTTECYLPDPVQRFTRVSVTDHGLGAPHAFATLDQEVFLLDERQRVLQGGDRGFKPVSSPIQSTLETANTAGAFGYCVSIGPTDAVVFTLPADGRTFVYSAGVGWSQWASWNGAAYEPLIVNCLDDWTLVGTNDGYVAEYSLDAPTDLGRPIRCYVETGFQGDGRVRDCQRVLLTIRRGQSRTGARAQLSWRDDMGPWEAPLQVELDSSGGPSVVVELAGLGSYRYRQWRFEFTSDEPLSLAGAMEHFEVTES